MEAIEFITAIRERVIENDNQVYHQLLENTSEVKDPVWEKMLITYRGLDIEERLGFVQFLRLIQVNTLSHVLGILDGSTYLNDTNQNFILKTEQNEGIINGNLQDILLEMEEI